MGTRHKTRPAPHRWLAALFRQPPTGFYRTPAIYQSGSRMEIEHFRAVLAYDEDRLCLQMPHGRFTVYGDGLKILTLTASRLTLCGHFLRTDFADEQEAPCRPNR